MNWIIGLEILALILAWVQALGGVRTDEAKYLLNIPYPHPPFARWVLGLTVGLPGQEMVWRIVFASLLIQAAWLVWDMGRDLELQPRFLLASSWVLSAAVLTQAGSIMMAPLTALQALVLIWWMSCENYELRIKNYELAFKKWHLTFLLEKEWRALGVGLFWTASLFTAYQAAVFVPIVIVLLRRIGVSGWKRWLYWLGPLFLLGLYTLTNPLILATVVLRGENEQTIPLTAHLVGIAKFWLVAGSAVASALGTWGMIRGRSWPLLFSALLLVVFLFVWIPYAYYAILFTPLFVAGLHHVLARTRVATTPLLLPLFAGAAVLAFLFGPPLTPGPARAVMQTLIAQKQQGDVFITHEFGHDWQYESPFPVRYFRRPLLDEAQAVICQERCDDLGYDWKILPIEGLTLPELWVRAADSGRASEPVQLTTDGQGNVQIKARQ